MKSRVLKNGIFASSFILTLGLAGVSYADNQVTAITVDGNISDITDSAPIVQTVNDSFGDNFDIYNLRVSNDATYLYLGIASGYRTNGGTSGLWIAFDSTSGGENPLDVTSGGGGAPNLDPTFDSPFLADYLYYIQNGDGANRQNYFLDVVNTSNNVGIFYGTFNLNTGAFSPGSPAVGFEADVDNAAQGSNPANPGSAGTVATGFEFKIPLTALGINLATSQTLRVHVGGGDGSNSFYSNQILPNPSASASNYGNDPNFSTVTGDQHATYTLAYTPPAGPTVLTNVPVTSSPSNSSTASFTVTFNEAVAGFNNNADLTTTLTGSLVSTNANTITPVTTSQYTVNLAALSGEGTVTVAPNLASDITSVATSVALASTITSAAVTVDTVAATSAVTAPTTAQSGPGTFNAVFSGTATGAAAIATYELFISKNGGAFTSLGNRTSPSIVNLTTIYGAGNQSGAYQLYTRTTDAFGNVEAAPATGDVSFTYAFNSNVTDWSLLDN